MPVIERIAAWADELTAVRRGLRAHPEVGFEETRTSQKIAVPGVLFNLGHDGGVPLHNPGFLFDDSILPVGASILARTVETRG